MALHYSQSDVEPGDAIKPPDVRVRKHDQFAGITYVVPLLVKVRAKNVQQVELVRLFDAVSRT